MNVLRCRMALRPRSALDCMDLTLILIRDQLRPILRLLGLTVCPLWSVLCIGSIWTGGHWGWLVVAVLAGSVLQVPFTILGGRLFFVDQTSVHSVFRDVLEAWRAVLFLVLADVLILGFSAIFCFIFLPIVQGFCLFVGESLLLERVTIRRSIKRTLVLGGRHFGTALIGAVARWGCVVWLGLCMEAFGQFLVAQLFQLGTPFGSLMGGDVTPYLLLGVLLGHPFFALYRLILYMDVRTRMEGWDLQVAFRALALTGASR